MNTKAPSEPIRSEMKHIFGTTVENEQLYTIAGSNIAFVSGSHIVIYDPRISQQVQFISHSSTHISCIAFTIDGKKLAVAEYTKGSLISIYDLNGQNKTISQPKQTLKGHRQGVSLLAWSPNAKYLASLSNEDGGMFLWEEGSRVSQNKMGKKINKMIFTEEGDLVTIGKQSFKVWYFNSGSVVRVQLNDCWVIEGKAVNVGKKLMDKQFINVAHKNSKFLALTSDGMLCVVNNEAIEKTVDLKQTDAKVLEIYEGLALCGGEDGIIKVVNIDTLELQTVLPQPALINEANEQPLKVGNCIGLRVLQEYIVSLYKQKTMIVWEITAEGVRISQALMGHQDDIVCIELIEEISNQISFFATTSKDKTIRIWHIYEECFDNTKEVDLAEVIGIKKNPYCKNLTKVITCPEVISHIKPSNGLLVGASKRKIYVYSLTTFNLIYVYPIEQQTVEALEARNGQIFVALSDRTIKIFNISESMLKLVKIIDAGLPVESMRVVNKNLVVSRKGSFIVVDLDSDTVFKEENGVQAINIVNHKELYYLKGSNLHMYNLSRKKEKEPMPLQNCYQPVLKEGKGHQILKVITNFVLIVSVDNLSSSVRIWSHEGFLIHEYQVYEPIQEVVLCDDGNCIIACKNGSVIVEEFTYRQKFTKIQKQFKKWFEDNDLSWTAGSVWISQDLRNKNYSNAEDLLISINEAPLSQLPSHILSDSLVKSKLNLLTNVNIAYKKGDQTESIFNPSHISNQLNKIISNVQNIEKKIETKQNPSQHLVEEMTINLDDPFHNIKLSGQSKLVESMVSSFNPNINNFVLQSNHMDPEESMLLPVKGARSHSQDVVTNDNPADRLLQVLSSTPKTMQRFVSDNESKLRTIYSVLHSQFSPSTGNTKMKAVEEVTQEYLSKVRGIIGDK